MTSANIGIPYSRKSSVIFCFLLIKFIPAVFP